MGYDLHSLTPARDWEETLKEAQDTLRPLPEGASIDEVVACINQYYDCLESAGDYVRFNVRSWFIILDTALEYGWQPEHELDYYMKNDGQTASRQDAENLASALEVALTSGEVDPLWQAKVEKFIAFCRRDGFQIW